MLKTIVITGANGQLGAEFKSIKVAYPEFNFVFASKEALNITNAKKVANYLTQHKVDYLVNCAAYTAVDAAETNQNAANLVNAKGSSILANACQQASVVLIHVSTDYVFDGASNELYSEEAKTNPLSVYGKSKLIGETAIKTNCEAHYIIRTSWLYSSFNTNFVKSMLKLGESRAELSIVADQYGSPTYAKDLAKTILTIIKKTEDKSVLNKFGTYHYSNKGVTTWYGFAKKIMELAQTACKVNPIPTEAYPLPAPRPKNSSMNTAKIEGAFGIKIPKWEESLAVCLSELINKK